MSGHEHHEAEVIEAAERVVEGVAEREVRIAPRRRRILRALHDLGVLQAVGRDWLTTTDEGIAFTTLDDAQADRLAGLLEDLAAGIEGPDLRPTAGQGSFDFAPEPGAGPRWLSLPRLQVEAGR